MKSIFTFLSLIVAFALAVPATSTAAAKKKTDKTADTSKAGDKKDDDKKKDTYPLYGEVVSITDSLLTIKGGKDKPDHKYDITKDTKIHSGDKSATVKDVKVGSMVGGLLKKAPDGKGNPTVVSLNLDVKQKKSDKKTEGDKPATTKKKKS